MHAGAKRHTNRWPEQRYVEVGDEITRRYGVPVVLTGTPAELPMVESIASKMRGRAVILCGELSLAQLAALLARSCLYVGNDTGPMHLAASVGTPTVSIFSARDFQERWHPVGSNHIALRRDAPCSPCFKEICDRDLICLQAIQPDDVLLAVEEQMGQQVPTTETGRQWAAAD
jgi:heptosyltransferase-2/heptosyltransferase-3